MFNLFGLFGYLDLFGLIIDHSWLLSDDIVCSVYSIYLVIFCVLLYLLWLIMAICDWHGSPRVSPRGCARWLEGSFATSFHGPVSGDPVCDVCDVFVYSDYSVYSDLFSLISMMLLHDFRAAVVAIWMAWITHGKSKCAHCLIHLTQLSHSNICWFCCLMPDDCGHSFVKSFVGTVCGDPPCFICW